MRPDPTGVNHYVGRIVRSARSCSCRATSTGGLRLSTSFAALKKYLLLRGSDLRLDDVDGDLLPTQQPGDAIPHARRALVGVHGRPHRAREPGMTSMPTNADTTGMARSGREDGVEASRTPRVEGFDAKDNECRGFPASGNG